MSVSEGFSNDLAGNSATYGWLNSSGRTYGTINPYYDVDWYTTYLTAGVQYRIQMSVSTMDAFLVLRDSSGAALSYADNYGAGFAETITFTPSTSGVYYVDAESYRQGYYNTGAYVISLTSNAADDLSATTSTTSTLSLGTPVSGRLELAADADWHRVGLVAGHSYSFQVSGTRGDAFLKIFTSSGLEAGTADRGLVTFTPSTTGTYFVEVSGNLFTDVGSYSLVARELPKISVSDERIAEGDAGTSALVFVVSLSAASTADVSVQFDTSNDTAVVGRDYSGVSRVVTIPAGATSVQVAVPILGNTYFEPNRGFWVNLSRPINASLGDASGWGLIDDDDAPPELSLPTDPSMPFQWYLYTIRAQFAWELATGRGVKVGIFDQGIDATNSDLSRNTSTALGVTASSLAPGGAPVLSTDNHGTMVAGVLAAARDGSGIVGVAYDATLVPIYSSLNLSSTAADAANAFSYAKNLDVVNNSWGFGNALQNGTNWAFLDDASKPAFAAAFAALRDLAASGRHGLGTVVVQSAGNSYGYGDDTNLHNFQNSRYVITVGATDYFGQASSFSTTGASILVSAPGGHGNEGWGSILTTDRSGSAGNSSGNYAYVDGTSFSSPIVAGVVAMMLEANPTLGYRDVQQILAYTARRTDVGVGDWSVNGARNWNGGGLHYNSLEHAAGFGQVDALAAVRLAAGWAGSPLTASNATEVTASSYVNAVIPDNSLTGVFSAIQVRESIQVERVDVTVNIQHSFIGDLSILLRSPSGTTSFLLWRPAQGALSAYGSSQNDVHFTFDSVLDWGENSQGVWSLFVTDSAAGDVGRLSDWTITLVGKPASNDDVYVYTNEYADVVAANPARAVLSDTNGGYNTLNAAALGLDNRIDLTGATASVLNGTNLTIAYGTYIARAMGGDGYDVLIANDLGGDLRGMGGNDTFAGGRGNDRFDGGEGVDTLIYNGARATYGISKAASAYTVVDQSGRDGTDTLNSVERIMFADGGIALDVSPTQSGGKAALLLGALLPGLLALHSAKQGLMGDVIELFDSGFSMAQLSGAVLRLPIWDVLTGNTSPSNDDIALYLLTNVIGRAPDHSTLSLAVDALNTGSLQAQGDWLANLALSAESQTHIGLAGLAESGLAFVI